MINKDTHFKKQGYYVYRNAISEDLCKFIANYYHNQYDMGLLKHTDSQVPTAYVIANNDMIGEILHKSIYEKYSDFLSNINLIPTYSYGRYYFNGSILDRHIDRPECELSATLTIDYDKEWPLWIEDFNGKKDSVVLKRGDLVFYHGCDLHHWREKYEGDYTLQIFFHFINSNNPDAIDMKEATKLNKSRTQFDVNNKAPYRYKGKSTRNSIPRERKDWKVNMDEYTSRYKGWEENEK